ncbi:MAG TPA: hypothetical protein VFH57_07905 [Gammaproteobacteria bacterium]|nr:hypothetical protein [Gammaproteobacteria bacterium]
MVSKSQQLQIRVTPREKAALKRLAAAARQDVSSYVLARALPPSRLRFEELLAQLRTRADHRYLLAELNDFLSALAPGEFCAALSHADLARLSPFLSNYVAAMVEQAAHLKGVAPPAWTAKVAPLATPQFAAPLKNLRPHLLRAAPVAFKRRNLFVDATVGARV